MEIIEKAEDYIWLYLNDGGVDTTYISTTGTLDNLMNDGWTPTEIIAGKADGFILDNISWI